MASLVIPYIDASDEKSSATFRVSDAITDPDITLLYDATVALTRPGEQQAHLISDVAKDGTNPGKPADKLSQRENKFLCRAINSEGEVATLEIPCADLEVTDDSASIIDLSSGAGLAFKTEFDKSVLNRDGESLTLQSVTFVGRNI